MRQSKLTLTLALTATFVAGSAVVIHDAREAAGPAVAAAAPAPRPPAVPDEPRPTPAVGRPARPGVVLSVDGQDVRFPAARLTVTRATGGLHAILCTDDPPAAIEAGYAGNSFMFDMTVGADRPADLPTAAWEYVEGRSSDATGLFLHGNRDALAPTPGVRVTFEPDGVATVATVSGTFLRLDTRDPSVAPERVQVYGTVRCLAAER